MLTFPMFMDAYILVNFVIVSFAADVIEVITQRKI